MGFPYHQQILILWHHIVIGIQWIVCGNVVAAFTLFLFGVIIYHWARLVLFPVWFVVAGGTHSIKYHICFNISFAGALWISRCNGDSKETADCLRLYSFSCKLNDMMKFIWIFFIKMDIFFPYDKGKNHDVKVINNASCLPYFITPFNGWVWHSASRYHWASGLEIIFYFPQHGNKLNGSGVVRSKLIKKSNKYLMYNNLIITISWTNLNKKTLIKCCFHINFDL